MIELDIDDIIDFVKDHWKPILVLVFLFITGIAAVLYQTIDQLEETEQQVKEESTAGIIDTFAKTGEETSDSISDPGARAIYKILWVFLGLILVVSLIVAIGKVFEPIITALNPVNIAKSFS